MPTLTPYNQEYVFSNAYREGMSMDQIPPAPRLHITNSRTYHMNPYYLAICPTCQKKMHSIHNERMHKCIVCGYSISHESFLNKKNDPRKIEHARIRRERRAFRNRPIGIVQDNMIGSGYVNFDMNSIASTSPWTTTGTYTFGNSVTNSGGF